MKKFSAILICLLMLVTCSLAGCATFSIDKAKYYNEVLATVDETKITRFDLLTAYNSYGYSYYVSQQGQTEEQALSSTLDLLIDRELMYQYALDNNDLYNPTAYQVNSVIQEMFDSLDEQMTTYVESAKTILNIESEEKPTEEESSTETAYLLKDYSYSPRAELNFTVKEKTVYYKDATYSTISEDVTEFDRQVKYNDYYIDYVVEEEPQSYDKLIAEQYLKDFTLKNTIKEIKSAYLEHFLNELTIDEDDNANTLYNKAIALFANDLIDYEFYLRDENGKEYSKDTESLLTRYFERTFESQIQSQYLENIRVHYLENEYLSLDVLKEEFEYLLTYNYNTYNNNHETYKNKMKDIGTDGDDVLYHPTTDTKFGYFIHTLISFDSIKDNLTILESIKDEEVREDEYNKLVGKVTVKARDLETGLVPEDAESVSIASVIDEYNKIKTDYSTYEDRLSAFVKFMFKYSSDTATLTQGMPYVVGTDGYSSMVEEFTNEAISLMEGEAGNMSTASIYDIDGLCITEYGLHLLFYVGDVNSYDLPYEYSSKAYIATEDIEGNEEYNLYTKVINPLTNKTYFDKMFDLVYPANSGEVYTSNSGYTKYEESLTELSKKAHTVTKYTTKIEATKTSI